MRLWSIHPKYLDPRGLVALWREALLAKAVLLGKTKGYIHHPQLIRLRKAENPANQINYYLSEVWYEAEKRGYHFDRAKVNWAFIPFLMTVTNGQIAYEFDHLLRKLSVRDTERYHMIVDVKNIETHPMFSVIEGGIAEWEIQKMS